MEISDFKIELPKKKLKWEKRGNASDGYIYVLKLGKIDLGYFYKSVFRKNWVCRSFISDTIFEADLKCICKKELLKEAEVYFINTEWRQIV